MNAHAVPPVPPPLADITFRLWRGLEELPAMLRWGEERLRAMAEGLPAGGEPAFYVWADDTQQELHAVLAAEAYQAIRYGNLLTRPAIATATHPLPVAPLPAGIEHRPHGRRRYDRSCLGRRRGQPQRRLRLVHQPWLRTGAVYGWISEEVVTGAKTFRNDVLAFAGRNPR